VHHFLLGEVTVSVNLLHMVDINILEHIFTYLPEEVEMVPVKSMVLQLIMEKCKDSTAAEAIGGVEFFQRVLFGPDPHLA
jgi:hypothetical protein